MTEPPVTSEILDSRLILHLEVVSEELGGWEPEEGGGLMRRDGRLGIRVLDVLKGRLDQGSGDVVELVITERGTGTGRVMDYYGIWAHVSTAAGTRLVAFCDGASTDLRVALTEEHCDQLVAADSVLGDVGLALALEARRPTSARVLAEAERLRESGGALFARYVWARARNTIIGSADAFSTLMRIAEDPRTRTEAREAYLVAAYEDATFTEALSPDLRAGLARSMFRTALDPAVGEIRGHLLGTFIPNLVRAPVPGRLSARDVFADHNRLQDRVRADEVDPQTSRYPERLRGWLTAEEGDG